MAPATTPFLMTRTLSSIFLLHLTLVSGDEKSDADFAACGLWLGPSSIKVQERQGFGLGMFTGKLIAKGDDMPAELLVPIYDWDDEDHPPLREYIWDSIDNGVGDMVLESMENMNMFIPGLASIAPCTATNYNLKLNNSVAYNDWGVHRFNPTTPTAGAFSYRTSSMFSAVRDILPGEELVVQCNDHEFDGDTIPSPAFDAHHHPPICLDDTLEEQPSTIHGRGLFTKRNIPQSDTILLSTPMTPIHRNELKMENEQMQLLLNYCYGHPESVLLWLPHGPLINSLNHSPSRTPNARIQWRSILKTTDELSQRVKFHHPELFQALPENVATAHGKGLVMELVSTQAIARGEEVVIDYGDAWVTSWENHRAQWSRKRETVHNSAYISANGYNQLSKDDKIRTVTEQHHKPYPPNLHTACYFEADWASDENFQEDVMTYESWNNQNDHFTCLLPCLVIEAGHIDGDTSGNTLYTAKLVDNYGENVAIDWECHIYDKFEYFYTDIPREGIIFVENPEKSDVWLPDAFRHMIGVPDSRDDKMYPDIWKIRNMRRRATANIMDSDYTSAFKRKNVTPRQDSLDLIRIKMM